MDVIDKLSALIYNSDKSISELSRKSKISRQGIYDILNKRAKSISTKTLESLAYALGYNPYEILNRPDGKVPILGHIPAGTPYESVQDILGYVDLNEDYFGDKCFALKVDGNSMHPLIEDNDLVIVDTSQKNIINSKIYAVYVNGYDATLKRVKKTDNGIMLIPENHDGYEPMFYTNTQIQKLPVSIVGRVVEIRSKNGL